MEIIWTNQALKKIGEFVDYISQDSPEIAEEWAKKVFTKTDQLISQPRSGRIVPEYNEENLRELIAGNYRIIYRIKKDAIYIQTVRHVRQNLSGSSKL